MAKVARSHRHIGRSRLAYTPDGAVLYSGGDEGFLRVFSARPEDEAKDQLALIEDDDESPILTMDASMESLVVGGEDGKVRLYDHTTREFTGLVTESPLGMSIRCVKFSPNGHRVAVASDETTVKVVDVRDITKLQSLEGHTKSVRAVTWSPDGQLITTSGCDGQIRVWDVSNPNEQEPQCIRVIDGLIGEEDSDSNTQSQAIWHPSGRYFVVGTKSHEIAVVSRSTWEREGAFDKDGHTGAITTLAFSPNGRYLCSTATDKAVRTWDTTSRRVIETIEENVEEVSDLVWRPGAGSNSIAWADVDGFVNRWHNVIPAEHAHPNDAPAAGARDNANAEAAHNQRKDREVEDNDLDLGFDDADVSVSGTAARAEDDLTDEDDFIEDDDDDGVYRSRYAKDGSLPPPLASRHRGSVVVASSSSGRTSSLVKGQEPFQPGATPLKEKRRYLAFNSLGAIHIVERESHNIVSVDFHDQSAHTSEHFDDFNKFNLGCLGHNGVVYAQSQRSTGSLIEYKPFSTWGASNGGWSYDLPAGEEIKVIALGGAAANLDDDSGEAFDDTTGSGKVIAATSKNFLRFFSDAGSQTYLMSLGEEIVTMSAGQEWLIVVHRKSELITPGRQELNYTILDLDTYEVIQRGAVPLAKGASLAWIGFSEEQVPHMYDSTGFLSALDRARRPMQGRWIPMLDTNTLARREGKQESYWPVGAHGGSLMCVILKGGDKFPFFPTPITVDLDIQIPLLKLGETSGQLEAQLLQSSLLASHAKDSLPASTSSYSESTYQLKAKVSAYEVEMDKSILKLIQLACKNEKHQQAVGLAKMLHTSAAIGGAIKIANLYAISGLAERFEHLKDEKDGIYGSARRDIVEQQKREGKYAHLVDNRTIPDSALQIAHGTKGGASSNPLSMPFGAAPSKPKKTAKSVFSDSTVPVKPKTVPVQRQSTIAQGAGADSDDEPMHFDEEDDGVARGERQDSILPQDSIPASSVPVRAPFNPFAKRPEIPPSSAVTASSQAGPSNPFSRRNTAAESQAQSNSLKKTGSFFDRVDASNGLSSTGAVLSKTTSAGKQSTLFGLPPPRMKEGNEKKASNRGRKRKSDAATAGAVEEEDRVEVSSTRKQPKNIQNFFGGKPTSSSTAAESSGNKKARSASISDVEGSANAIESQAETQEALEDGFEPTQEQDQDAPEQDVPLMDGDNTSNESIEAEPITPAEMDGGDELAGTTSAGPAKNVSSLSKLAAFKFSASKPASVEAVSEEYRER